MQQITVTKTTEPKTKPADQSKLGFGNYFTDHMFLMNYDLGQGWHDPRIVPYGPIALEPSAMCVCTTGRRFLRGSRPIGPKTATFLCSAPTAIWHG